MKPRVTGQELMKSILAIGPAYGVWLERRNTGVARYAGEDGRVRTTRYGEPGTGDLSGILPSGRYIEIEAKATGEFPTEDQGNRILKINRLGGAAFWVDDIDVARNILTFLRDHPDSRLCYVNRERLWFVHPSAEFPSETLEFWPAPEPRPCRTTPNASRRSRR